MTLSHPELVILMPIMDDWEALTLLLPKVDAQLGNLQLKANLLIVDDGSTTRPPPTVFEGRRTSIRRIDVLHLLRNLGHQRAIAIGLAHLAHSGTAVPVLIMDGDGEDDPSYIGLLLERLRLEGGRRVVFAERTRRSESWAFRFFYWCFRVLNWCVTGHDVKMGNFSLVPAAMLPRLAVVQEIWNHYSAGVLKARIPYVRVPTSRARRLAGTSKLRFDGLVMHGLSAISVQGDVVSTRLLCFSSAAAVLLLLGIVVLTVLRSMGVPSGSLFIPALCVGAWGFVVLVAFLLSVVFAIMTLQTRQNSPFIPARDYPIFVEGMENVAGETVGEETGTAPTVG